MGPGAVPASHPLDAGTALRGIRDGTAPQHHPLAPRELAPGGSLFSSRPAHPQARPPRPAHPGRTARIAGSVTQM